MIVLFSVAYFIGDLFFFFDESSSSSGTRNKGDSSCVHIDDTNQIKFDKVEKPFVFYDYRGNRCGRGDCFYDSQGECRSWGDGFCDGKGYDRDWGDNYYDARGYFRSWGDCFYDAQGNLVYPNG